jgi:hypothetical protein
MKNIVFLLMVCVCILTPAAARADDGGFWDMLWHWDLKFSGYGTDFHVLCLDESGQRVSGCEEWFKNLKHLFHPRESVHTFTSGSAATARVFNSLTEIRHEFDFRFSYLHSYGKRFDDESLAAGDPNKDDDRRIHAFRLMGLYYYRINDRLDVGGGGGFIPVFGEDVTTVWRPIGTLSQVVWVGSMFYIRFDEGYVGRTVTGFGHDHKTLVFTAPPEKNLMATVGFDLRKVGIFRR